MTEWHCHAGGVQMGPMDESKLRALARAGTLKPDDLVWNETMPDWVESRLVPGLLTPDAAAASRPVAAPPGGGFAPGVTTAAVLPLPLPYRGMPMPALGSPAVQLADDPGPFEKIGGQFRIQKTLWNGKVIASPLAFYLMKQGQARQGGASMHFGILGILISMAFSKDADDLRTCTVDELPLGVRAALDPKDKNAARDVAVLNRGAVRCLTSGLGSSIMVDIGEDKVRLVRGFFAGTKLRQFLTQNGWAFDTVSQPTEAPATV